MRRSCVDQFEVSTSPRLPCWAFEQLESGSFKFPSPKAKIVLKYPTQVPALMVNFFFVKSKIGDCDFLVIDKQLVLLFKFSS